MIGDGEPRRMSRLEVQFTVNGKQARITSVDLRQFPDDRAIRLSSRKEGDVFVWENIQSGRWWLSAWSMDFHSVFTTQLEIGAAERQSFDIRLGHLRVFAALEEGMPESKAKMGYEVIAEPKGFKLERGYRGDLEKKTEHLDLFVPEGRYDVRIKSTGVPLVFEPEAAEATVATTGTTTVSFTARNSATVSFQCVTRAGLPVPGAEFLLTTDAAGNVPESERGRVQRGAMNGACTGTAPAGPVYLMIWVVSSDWNNPDKVFRLDLPISGVKDVGAVVVAP
jgi:hypothetical protein